MLMHAAAAFNRPAVIIAGGREPWWWTAYTSEVFEATVGKPAPSDFVSHDFIHTLGILDCCKAKGCMRHQLSGQARCLDLTPGRDRQYSTCLDIISPARVAKSVLAATGSVSRRETGKG